MSPKIIPYSPERIRRLQEEGRIELSSDHPELFLSSGRVYSYLETRKDLEGPSLEGVNAGDYSFMRDIASDTELGNHASRDK